jgi:hypothetical protein
MFYTLQAITFMYRTNFTTAHSLCIIPSYLKTVHDCTPQSSYYRLILALRAYLLFIYELCASNKQKSERKTKIRAKV